MKVNKQHKIIAKFLIERVEYKHLLEKILIKFYSIEGVLYDNTLKCNDKQMKVFWDTIKEIKEVL